MIKVYGPRLGSSLRAHWMLEELGLSYEDVAVDMQARQHKSPDFLKLNPTGQVPVLVDGDYVLSESMAITEYLGMKYNANLLGATPELKGQAWKWSLWAYLNVQKHFGIIAYNALWAPERDQSAIDKAAEDVKPFLTILNDHLAGKNHILGEHFSVADINVGITVGYGVMGGFDIAPFPNIQKWLSHVTSRPAYKKASAK